MDKQPLTQRIIQIINDKYSNYTVERNVDICDLFGNNDYANISLVVYDNEKVKLYIMIIGKTTLMHKEYCNTCNSLKDNKYPLIIFRKYLKNDDSYIIDKLKMYL